MVKKMVIPLVAVTAVWGADLASVNKLLNSIQKERERLEQMYLAECSEKSSYAKSECLALIASREDIMALERDYLIVKRQLEEGD